MDATDTTIDPARVRLSVDAHGVAEVAMVRSDKMNALDAAMFRSLMGAIDRLQADPAVRVVVLHGEGRAFCSGLDKSRFGEMVGGGEGSTQGTLGDLVPRTRGIANGAQSVAWGWRELPVPVIAAVHGVAFGGGLQVALGADLRIVRADVKLSVLEIQWGLVPDMAGIVLLTELCRTDVVRDLTFSGRIVGGDEAVRIGLATRLADDPLAAARELAREIAGRNPDAIRAGKRLLNGASPVDARAVLLAESHEQQRLIGSSNQVEAVRAGLAQRPPVFR
jgi:enoyl-CoA hydratase/carnithine racemase